MGDPSKAILKHINSLLPSTVWEATNPYGSILSFQMGRERCIRRHNNSILKIGTIRLDVLLCDWEIYLNDCVLENSNDITRDSANKTLSQFMGKALLEIVETSPRESVTLNFSDGYRIATKCCLDEYEKEDDWMVVAMEGDPSGVNEDLLEIFAYSYNKRFYQHRHVSPKLTRKK